MARPSKFKQADITRALRAGLKAGLNPKGYTIDANGVIHVVTNDSPAGEALNSFDQVLRP